MGGRSIVGDDESWPRALSEAVAAGKPFMYTVVPAVLTRKRGWCKTAELGPRALGREPDRAATGLVAGVDEREVDSGGWENATGRNASVTGSMQSL